MEQNLPTCGQLERNLAQSVQKLYLRELEHSPDKVICQLFGNQLAIVIENSLTAVEQVLATTKGFDGMVKHLNTAINEIVASKLKTMIEETLSVQVEGILLDTTIENKRTGAIATLSQSPRVRNPGSIPKNKSDKLNQKSAPVKFVYDANKHRCKEELETGNKIR